MKERVASSCDPTQISNLCSLFKTKASCDMAWQPLGYAEWRVVLGQVRYNVPSRQCWSESEWQSWQSYRFQLGYWTFQTTFLRPSSSTPRTRTINRVHSSSLKQIRDIPWRFFKRHGTQRMIQVDNYQPHNLMQRNRNQPLPSNIKGIYLYPATQPSFCEPRVAKFDCNRWSWHNLKRQCVSWIDDSKVLLSLNRTCIERRNDGSSCDLTTKGLIFTELHNKPRVAEFNCHRW